MSLLCLAMLLSQQPDTVRLPELVSTASRLPVRAAVLPSTHTVITGAELRERGIILLLDALRDVPGLVTVQAGSSGAATSLFLRGGESDYVKVLVDGVPMNAPGGNFNLANLVVTHVDRIEVVRGPASVLYGADAMTGVIQVFTRSGQGPVSPEVTLEAGTHASRRVTAGVRGEGPGIRLSLQGTHSRTGGLYPFNSEYRNTSWSGRIATREGAPLQAHITAREGEVRSAFPTNSSGEPVDSNQYLTERQLALGGGLSRALARGLAIHVEASLSRTADGFVDQMDRPGDTTGFGFAASRRGRSRRSGGEVRLAFGSSGNITAIAGVHYEDERQRQSGSTSSNFGGGAGTEEDSFRAARTTRAAFGEASIAPLSRVTLFAGGRLDDNSAFGTAASWRVGAAVGPSPGLTIRAQGGRAFKAPTFPELFANTPFEVGDPTLQPERASSWEVGVEQRLGDGRVHLTGAWFTQRFRNLIQYAGAPPGLPTYGNISAATSSGGEIGARALVTPQLDLGIQASYTRTRVTEAGAGSSPAWLLGEPLLRRPELTGSALVRWHFSPGTSGRLDVHHLGGRDDVDFREFPSTRVRLPARTLTDLSVAARLARGVTIAGRVENLFGQPWQQVVGFPARGRTLAVTLSTQR